MIKKNDTVSIVSLLVILYAFFISRRGGDTKYIFAIVLMLISGYEIIRNRFEIIKNEKKLYIFGSLYLLLTTFSFLINRSIFSNKETFFTITLWSVIYFLLTLNLNINEKIQKNIIVIVTIFSLDGVLRGIKDIFKHMKQLSWYRISGGTYTTVYAMEIGIYILLGIYCLWNSKRWYYKFLSSIYIIVNIVLLVATKSRNTMLMLPIALILTLIALKPKKGLIACVITLFLGIGLIKSSKNIKPLARMYQLSSIEKIKNDPRYEIYKKGLEIGKEKPLLGVGMQKIKKEGIYIEKYRYKFPHFHNVFLEIFVTQGLVVLISYLLFLGTLLYKFYLNLQKDKKYVFGFCLVIFTFSYGMFESIIYFSKLYPYVFMILALILIGEKNESDNTSRGNRE